MFASVGTDPICASPQYAFETFYLQGDIHLRILLWSVRRPAGHRDDPVDGFDRSDGRFRNERLAGRPRGVGRLDRDAPRRLHRESHRPIPGVSIPANFLSHLVAVRLLKTPETFGTGNPQGVVAAESANNGSAMGALVPAMALAIPGGASALGRWGYSLIAFILSPIAEWGSSALLISGGDYGILVESPISAILLVLSVVMLFSLIVQRRSPLDYLATVAGGIGRGDVRVRPTVRAIGREHRRASRV